MEYTPNEVIGKVGALLQEDINEENILQLEKLQFELAQARTQTMQYLYEKESQMLYPKGKEVTELDRKISLNASVSVIRRDYEMLQSLEKLVVQRIELFIQLQRQL